MDEALSQVGLCITYPSNPRTCYSSLERCRVMRECLLVIVPWIDCKCIRCGGQGGGIPETGGLPVDGDKAKAEEAQSQNQKASHCCF